MTKKLTDETYEQSAEDDSIKVGSSVATKTTVAASTEVLLTFRENRAYELHIGRSIIPFGPRETKKVNKTILSHSDWTPNVAAKFIVQEIK